MVFFVIFFRHYHSICISDDCDNAYESFILPLCLRIIKQTIQAELCVLFFHCLLKTLEVLPQHADIHVIIPWNIPAMPYRTKHCPIMTKPPDPVFPTDRIDACKNLHLRCPAALYHRGYEKPMSCFFFQKRRIHPHLTILVS